MQTRNSSEITTLFLFKDLKIRQFTPAVTGVFKIVQGDIGRLFTDQVTDLDYPDMFTDAKEVLRTLVASAKAVATHDGRWYIVRIMPYRTYEDKIDGLVITFIDTTISKKLEMALLETQTMLRSFIARVPGVIIGLTVEGIIIEFNPEAEKIFDRKRQDVINKNYVNCLSPNHRRKKCDQI